MHENEVLITPANGRALLEEANLLDELGPKGHNEALFAQVHRQMLEKAPDRAKERGVRP